MFTEEDGNSIKNQHRKAILAILILPNSSQSKGYQTMEFGKLIKYHKRNIFLQKLSSSLLSRPLFIFFENLKMR